jgi:hypothetical protein
MTQALYAHMNNKRKKKETIKLGEVIKPKNKNKKNEKSFHGTKILYLH